MSEDRGYVIELAGEAAGLVVKEGNRFRFYSAARDFLSLDRTLFRSPADAEAACRRVALPGRTPQPQGIAGETTRFPLRRRTGALRGASARQLCRTAAVS